MRAGMMIAIGAGALLTSWMIFAPNFDGPYKRQHANEASTVGKIRTINQLQVTYASDRGRFTCTFGDLIAISDKRYTLVRENGEFSGYRFSLANCDPNPNNPKYQVIAVPREPGKSGFKAFCSDET